MSESKAAFLFPHRILHLRQFSVNPVRGHQRSSLHGSRVFETVPQQVRPAWISRVCKSKVCMRRPKWVGLSIREREKGFCGCLCPLIHMCDIPPRDHKPQQALHRCRPSEFSQEPYSVTDQTLTRQVREASTRK